MGHVPLTADRNGAGVAADFAAGWLAFERPPDVLAGAVGETAGGPAPEKRRVSPVPAGWAALPDAALHALLAAAPPVAPRRPAAAPAPRPPRDGRG